MIRRPPRSTLSSSSAASDVYKRQVSTQSTGLALDTHTMRRLLSCRAVTRGLRTHSTSVVLAPELRALQQLGLPCFRVCGEQVRVLRDGEEFLEQLLALIRGSTQRIAISSLYLGTGAAEKRLVRALGQALEHNHELKLSVVLDYNRAQRRTKAHESSLTVLQPLIERFPGRAELLLFHTPHRAALTAALGARLNEVLGVQHMKVLCFDHSVCVTGANLEAQYFAHRQDRYAVMHCPALAEHYHGLLSSVGTLSFRVLPGGALEAPHSCPHPSAQPGAFCQHAADVLHAGSCGAGPSTQQQHGDTWLLPTVQFGPAGVTQDQAATAVMLAPRTRGLRLWMSSGYFNLCAELATRLLTPGGVVHILTAAPRANSFFGAAGAAGLITRAYSLLQEKFVLQAAGAPHVSMCEYQRQGWTYHAKGLWLAPEDSPVLASALGSPNLGRRSRDLDLESQVLIFTDNKQLQARLTQELHSLLQHTGPVTASTFHEATRFGSEYNQSWERRGVHMKLITRLAAGFL
eukprot:TRINITY_DN13974_c0_g1_i1.p1 TRINITY_DN13974_c0_g1~~TRINITY_DN13974_c0_g1_i1.p1  ORF type:complete len:518 (-),score=144.66 TRINITY_DN13974_c0_g1_i1:37-1590(-)